MENEEWSPKTKMGKKVKTKEITDIDEILTSGHPIIEPRIVDELIPDLKTETISIKSTQRVTKSGRKIKFRAIVVIGDGNGHVGIGSGKSAEVKPAIQYAEVAAKKNIMRVRSGCGSWECRCKESHSVPQTTEGKEGSTKVKLYPAPRGVGLAANKIIKKILLMAGVKDIWSKTNGNTDNIYNTGRATIEALDALNKLKARVERNE